MSRSETFRALLVSLLLGAGCASSSPPAATPHGPGGADWRYGLVVDASSSASTLFAFRWRPSERPEPAGRLPRIESEPLPGGDPDCQSVEPGLGDYGGRPLDAARSLDPLIRCAVAHVGNDPETLRRSSLHLRGTAGLRLLPDDQRTAIIESVSAHLEETPFGDTSARLITGDEEGIFGWLSVNYLLGHLDHGGAFPTVGALDLGGASTQITFVPLDHPREHGRTITLAGTTYHLYTHSYLGLGQDRAREAVDSPACFLVGYPLPGNRVGTGDYAACRAAIRGRLGKACDNRPCSLFGIHQPPAYGDFLAFSVYHYTAGFFGLSGRLSPAELETAAIAFCASDWADLVAADPSLETNPYVPNYCFSAAYVVTLLIDGWGLPFEGDRVHAPRRIQGANVGWALGALLYELAGSSD